ncbi:hypothetical protein MMMDOFMJ_0143 [Methylobacterium gnaphalii]|nr:hypothetical protein MMMDOFMJ_0143 [Methylobacterium gnaphalii]
MTARSSSYPSVGMNRPVARVVCEPPAEVITDRSERPLSRDIRASLLQPMIGVAAGGPPLSGVSSLDLPAALPGAAGSFRDLFSRNRRVPASCSDRVLVPAFPIASTGVF